MSLSFWDGAYRTGRRIWGARPSEIARAVDRCVGSEKIALAGKRVLDAGCGYGRDTVYLADRWKASVLGVDPSEPAIEMALGSIPARTRRLADFRRARFQELGGETFDAVYAANLCQILPPQERREFASAAAGWLPPGAWLLLGTLSIRDPQHAGKGKEVPGDPNSWVDEKYIHLSPREELEADFSFLEIRALFEHEYLERRSGGEAHHHISWILIGRRKP